MADLNINDAHTETLDAWNANAAYWDDRMGEGNDFVNVLIWPALQRMLDVRAGERVLEIACGNGLYARRLAALGAEVVATDFAPEMIAVAQARPSPPALTPVPHRDPLDCAGQSDDKPAACATFPSAVSPPAGKISYAVVDATDEAALLALGGRSFDAAICMMGLMDMAEIAPLMRALTRLLRPGGRFVFSIMHPCFNSVHTTLMGEQHDQGGRTITTYSVKISGYMTPSIARGTALREQPKLQVYFHRPLQDVLNAGFSAGFVMDALEERAFPPDHPLGKHPLSWGALFSEIPPVLIARLRPTA